MDIGGFVQNIRCISNQTAEKRGKKLLKKNLEKHDDWIVLNSTMQTLAEWSGDDVRLRRWLVPRLEKLGKDPRKSVSGRAKKLLLKIETL